VVTYSQSTPRVAPVPSVAILPSDARIQFTDYAGTLTRSVASARIVRPISDGRGFEYANPGARARISVTLASAGVVSPTIAYTGLITQNDTYADQGVILVNGAVVDTFNCPSPHDGIVHPTGTIAPEIPLTAGSHLVEVVYPYCASVDLLNFRIPVTATAAAPAARPGPLYTPSGDSITHGFYTDNSYNGWASMLGRLRSARTANIGYGSRVCTASDGTVAGATGCDFATYLIGFNDYYAQVPLATFKAAHQAYQTNFRAAAVAAGRPNAKLVVITPLFSTFSVGNSSIPLSSYRQAIRDAVTAVGDANVQLVEGLAPGMPSSAADLLDGIHPNNAGAVKVATVLDGQIA